MIIQDHHVNHTKIAEIVADSVVLQDVEGALDLIGNLTYQGYEKIILHEKNIIPQFFDLKTKLAGEILQKFVQYRMAIVIIGDFSKYRSASLNDFILESNRGNRINFFSSLEAALNSK